MFISSHEYLGQLTALINASDRLDIAVAFWGEASVSLLQAAGDKPVRIICNLASGGTNPRPIKRLLEQGINLRQLDDLHAKVVLGTDKALVGSANFSTNGLQLEDSEAGGWSEAGLLTSSATDLRAIGQWFDAEWDRARPVEAADLERSLIAWEIRRANRPELRRARTITDLKPAEVKDRQFYVIIWSEKPSEGASAIYEQVVSQATEKAHFEQSLLGKLDFYEGWPEMPKEGVFLSFKSHLNGGYRCDGVWRRMAELDVGPGETHKGLQIVMMRDEMLGFHITGKVRKELEKKLGPVLDDLWRDFQCSNGGGIIPLDKVLERL